MEFMLALSENISQLQVYVGSFETLCKDYNLKNVYYKEHPFNIGYTSFFAYWEKVEKQLNAY